MERVLVVEDSVMQGQYMQAQLQDTYEIALCSSPKKALAHIRAFRPCLILMDVIMPELSGFDILASLKADSVLQGIPVILITGLAEVGDEKRGLDLGAVDYIVKPYSAEILKARVRTHVRISTLQRSMEALMRMDALTGIFNRRYVEECSKGALADSMEKREVYSLGMIDVDCFKKYNDTYGHLGGDTVLRTVAQTASSCLTRKGQFIARYGGEEFLFGIASSGAQEGQQLAEHLRKQIMALGICHTSSPVAPVLTVSVGGLTGVPQKGETLEQWIQQADDQLYKAKASGRNCVMWKQI